MDALQGLGGMQGFSGLQSLLGSVNPQASETPSGPLPAGMPGGLAPALTSPVAMMQLQAITPIINQFLKPITDAQTAMQKTLAGLKKTITNIEKTSTASQTVIKQMSGQVTQILQASQTTGTETEGGNSTQTAGGGRRKQSRRFIPRKAKNTRRPRRR
jgi:hypothetical protein